MVMLRLLPVVRDRYRKGKKSITGNLWWEMHEECMVVCAEALLPLAITAVFTTGGPHNSAHAKWGEYLMVISNEGNAKMCTRDRTAQR